MPVTLPYTLTNGEVADADQVMANMNAFVAKFNAGIGSDDLAANAVGTEEVTNLCLTTGKYANLSVTGDKLATDSVLGTKIPVGAIGASGKAHLADASLTWAAAAAVGAFIHRVAWTGDDQGQREITGLPWTPEMVILFSLNYATWSGYMRDKDMVPPNFGATYNFESTASAGDTISNPTGWSNSFTVASSQNASNGYYIAICLRFKTYTP